MIRSIFQSSRAVSISINLLNILSNLYIRIPCYISTILPHSILILFHPLFSSRYPFPSFSTFLKLILSLTYSFISIIVAISNPSQFVPIQKLSKILPSRITISSFRVNNSPSLNCLFTTTSELLPFLHLLLLFIFFLLFSFKFSGIFVSHSSFALFQLSYYP